MQIALDNRFSAHYDGGSNLITITRDDKWLATFAPDPNFPIIYPGNLRNAGCRWLDNEYFCPRSNPEYPHKKGSLSNTGCEACDTHAEEASCN